MPRKNKNTFSHFFKEDAEIVQDVLGAGSQDSMQDTVGLEAKNKLPFIKLSETASEDKSKNEWRKMRSFFRDGGKDASLPETLWPIGMSPQQTENIIADNFPLWVADENFSGEGTACLPLKDLINEALKSSIGGGDQNASIIKTNIDRILYIANYHLKDNNSQLFAPSMNRILEELEEQLNVSGEDKKEFERGLNHLKSSLPSSGNLLSYSVNTPFYLLEAAMLANQVPVRNGIKQEIHEIKNNLNDLLRVEQDKSGKNEDAGDLEDSYSFIDSIVKFDEVSSILPDSGSEMMGEERVARMKRVLSDLDEAVDLLDHHAFLFIDELVFKNKNIDWSDMFGKAEVSILKTGESCDSLQVLFDAQMAGYTKLFVAKKIGELELEDKYQPEVHDAYFRHFNWKNLSKEELNGCPYFILLVDDARFFESEFSRVARLLTDNYPIKIVAIKQQAFSVDKAGGSEMTEKRLHAQAELGGLMLSHKNIYVCQSTSITPDNLIQGFMYGLSAYAPAFFRVLNIDDNEKSLAWTSASIEGRDFPGFTFKGLLGTPWGSRFQVENNPQVNRTWPVHEIKFVDEKGNESLLNMPFTFADLAVLNSTYHRYYYPVSSSYWTEDLVPLTTYMRNVAANNITKLPFIWMLDEDNEMHKVVVSWHMVIATQERLDFWRFLQENSGINNYHVVRAIDQTKREMQEVYDIELEQINKSHKLEIRKIREEEAGNVMENLTSALLDLDISNLETNRVSAPIPITEAPKISSMPEQYTNEVPEKIEDEILSLDPYIDTPLCTTCDECTGLNNVMFKYNSDKMAFIADAHGGTFKELVEAAELCPVGIIHPGTPLNPNEDDLENLVQRAEKFN